MGMYTEILVKARVRQDIPENVKEILRYLFDNGEAPKTFPEHEFFTKPRWNHIGHCSSFYHHPKAVNSIWADREGNPSYIFSRSDIKDYDDEIKSFFSWVDEYLDSPEGQCIGYSWYEEDNEPTLVYKQAKGE